jgi:hypothetical protein
MNPMHENQNDRTSRSYMPRTWMEYRSSQLNVTKMSRALGHRLSTSLTFEVTVNCAHTRVHQTAKLGFMASFIHDLGMLDFDDGISLLQKRQENFSEALGRQNCLQFPLERGCRTEPPSLYGWGLRSVQIGDLTWLRDRRWCEQLQWGLCESQRNRGTREGVKAGGKRVGY